MSTYHHRHTSAMPNVAHTLIGGTRRYGQPTATGVARYSDLLACILDGHEPTESDVCAIAPGPDSAPAATPIPARPRAPRPRDVDCPEFADAEIGLVTRMLIGGATVAKIGDALALEPTYIDPLRELVRRIRAVGRPRDTVLRQSDGGKGKTRPRMLTVAEETEVLRLRAGGASYPELAEHFGVSVAVIRWCLRHPIPGTPASPEAGA